MVKADRTQKIVRLQHDPTRTTVDLYVTGYAYYKRADWRNAAINNLIVGTPITVNPSEYSLAKIM